MRNTHSRVTASLKTFQRGSGRTVAVLGALAVSLASITPAWALQGGEDPATLPVLLDKRYGPTSKHELSVMATTSMVNKLVQTDLGLTLGYQYYPNDLLGVGVYAGFFALTGETSIATAIRNTVGDPVETNPEDPLGDLYQMFWLTSAEVTFVPVYGKISFASELNLSFDLILLAGAGAGQTRRKVFVGNTETTDTQFVPIFYPGIGLRFHFLDRHAIRVEFRDYFYPDPTPNAGGLTWNLHFQLGYQFTFGGR